MAASAMIHQSLPRSLITEPAKSAHRCGHSG